MDNEMHNFIIQPRTERPVFTDEEILANFRKRFKGGIKAMSKREEVLNAITNSYPNAITREELMVLTGLCDRIVRANISKLRHKDNWIISNSSRSGYWLTKIPTLWDRFVDTWNQSNRYNMLKKSDYVEAQIRFEADRKHYDVFAKGIWGKD